MEENNRIAICRGLGSDIEISHAERQLLRGEVEALDLERIFEIREHRVGEGRLDAQNEQHKGSPENFAKIHAGPRLQCHHSGKHSSLKRFPQTRAGETSSPVSPLVYATIQVH